MLMHVMLIVSDGRLMHGTTSFYARVEIADGIISFFAPDEPEPRSVHQRARVVKVEMDNLRITVGGLVSLYHGHPDPAVRGRQTVYREWLLKPLWETEHARDNRIPPPPAPAK